MNKNTLILTTSGVALLALIAFLVTRQSGQAPGPGDLGAQDARAAGVSAGVTRQAPPPPVTREELLTRYGDPLVERAGQIIGKLRDLVTLAITVEENNLNGSTAPLRLRKELAHPVLVSLDLDENQREKLTGLLDDNQRRRVETMRDAAERLRSSPEPMMAYILAGDALHRELISPEDFARIRDASAFRFSSLITPNASQPLANKRFLAEFEALLSPEQQERFRENLRDAKDPSLAPPPLEDQAMPLDDFSENIDLCRKIYESSELEPAPRDGSASPDEPSEVAPELMPPQP